MAGYYGKSIWSLGSLTDPLIGDGSLDSSKEIGGSRSTSVDGYVEIRKIDHTLTIDPAGGAWNGSTSKSQITVLEGTTKELDKPIRTGYQFTGWSTFGAGSRPTTTGIVMGNEDTTATANWTPAKVNYTVKHYTQNLDGTY